MVTTEERLRSIQSQHSEERLRAERRDSEEKRAGAGIQSRPLPQLPELSGKEALAPLPKLQMR